jgi:predicted phage-related endonuclease
MASEIVWKDTHLEVAPPKRPKKLTGTRFAAVLGLSPWSTPFEAWCAITRTYEEPFEDTIYTKAGKVIEPKQAAYMMDTYQMSGLVTPTDLYGADYFKTTRGDFFPQFRQLGGMWDYLLKDDNGKIIAVFEMKTTKRAEDWKDDVPGYYALQAALYAWLLGVDQVYMVCSMLTAKDYEHPEDFVPSVKNTIVRPFKVSERYPAFQHLTQSALDWWDQHVKTGISPDYDEKKDAKILKALRTVTTQDSNDIHQMIAEAEDLQGKLDIMKEQSAPIEKALKAVNARIKTYMQSQFTEGSTTALYTGPRHTWTLSKMVGEKLDEERLEADGLKAQYMIPTVTYRLTVAKNNEEVK